jgi:hypothetical protein
LILFKIVPQRGEEKRFEPQRAQRAQRKSVGRVLGYDCDYWFEKRREESWERSLMS